MTEEQFAWRFSARVFALSKAKGKPFGQEPVHYAQAVYELYWHERFPYGASPEECADEDAEYWDTDRIP